MTPVASDLSTAKSDLRRAVLARRAAIGAAERQAAAAALAHAWPVLAVPAGAVVSGFVPVRGEIDVLPLLAAARAAGHPVALPVLDGAEDMIFRLWDPAALLIAGRFGLSEPGPEAPPAEPDVLLVPLAAFDRLGGRLGYGRGYYDRALARLDARRRRRAIGIAFAAQEVERVPTGPHDRPLDAVLTEAGLRALSPPADFG
jgi:5-formyltetrahydrofolate cyclo-ligase